VADLSTERSEIPPRPARTFSNIALPIPDVPLAFESIEEYTIRFSDGTSKSEVTTVKTYRDAAGRMRIERKFDSPHGRVLLIQIFDYAAGFMVLLEIDSKIAHRARTRKVDQPVAQPKFIFFGGPLAAAPGEKKFNSEALGKQTIAGAEFEGHRLTTTIEGEPSLVSIQEHWMSVELGLIGFMSSSGPDLEETVRIRRMDRIAPDPVLFVIPGDYPIQELGDFSADL
jgi:hypothetical protein